MATTTATSSPFEAAASGILSFIQNGPGGGNGSNIYTAGTLGATETKNLVALSLGMAALGVLLCFGSVPAFMQRASRRRAFPVHQQPRTSGSQA